MHRHYNKRRFPEGPDGPEVTLSLIQPATGNPVIYEGVMVMASDPPRLSTKEQDAQWATLIERSKQENPDDPMIGQWVSFTASAYPEEDKRELD